ncbi:LysR family transcriptional regulator [Marinicrinis lubricantis]|uniref:LysR family transcriptional regulator n=1 Tax=Marinicrinis lubricantis TaxID=2086470 RepID=A0ABW1IQT6_9BACL
MELLQLKYFQKVAKLEHMTRAAEELHIAQPALSKTISRLEEDLGVPLFDRRSRQIRLNAYGKAFLQKVETVLMLLEEGRREVADLAGMEKGIISIATTTLCRLTKALSAFREKHPSISFRITQLAPSATEEMVKLLENGEVDLCFGAAALERPGLDEQVVLKARVYLGVPKGHRLAEKCSISLQEAAEEPFIEYKDGHPFRKINEQFCRTAGIRRNIVCEVEEPDALASLVGAGIGVAFVPGCKGEAETTFSMVQIHEPECYRSFTISSPENRYLSLAAREFRSFLTIYFDELMKQEK